MSHKTTILVLLVVAFSSSTLLWLSRGTDMSSGDTQAVFSDTVVSNNLSPIMSPKTPIVSPKLMNVTNVTKIYATSLPSLLPRVTTEPPKIESYESSSPTPEPSEESLSPSPVISSVTPTPTPAEPSSIVINEIAWAGTVASQYGEWIELYNPGSQVISLDGWGIFEGEIRTLSLSGSIAPGAYFLIERATPSSPDPILDIVADYHAQFGGAGLRNNPGEYLQLRDFSGTIVDSVDCSDGPWYAGDNVKKMSMERVRPDLSGINQENWKTNNGIQKNGHDAGNNEILGTPKTKNSVSP